MPFEHLFTPIKIGNKTVKNRICSTTHRTYIEGYNDDEDIGRYVEYQRARAKGGCGLIVLANVHPDRHSSIAEERGVPTPKILSTKLKRMADACHEYGTTVVIQLAHTGNPGPRDTLFGNIAVSAPPRDKNAVFFDEVHELEDEEIDALIDKFVVYAKAAQDGGLDGIEIHAAHGYALQASYSNWTNLRTDKWQGLTVVKEMAGRMRKAVGSDFIVGFKMPSDDFHAGGMDNVAMGDIAQELEASGYLDYIALTQGSGGTDYKYVMGVMQIPPAAWVPLASGIKQRVQSIPIMAIGRINDPTVAEGVLAEAHADLVGITRGQIADPEFANKAREGRMEDIRLCIACNQGCIDRTFTRDKFTCLQNAAAGREVDYGTIRQATRKKKVVVVGGGPGGMEAARAAAVRGHQVTLLEKADQLGGTINILIKAPGREEFSQVTRYLTTQLNKLHVQVKLGVEATAETVLKENPDAVIVATGALPHRQIVPGSDQENVLLVEEVLQGASVGNSVVVYDATGLQEGVSAANFLVDQGKHVQIVTPLASVAPRLGFTNAAYIIPQLATKGVVFTTLSALCSISGRTVVVANVFTNEERVIENVDTVVLATGYRSNNSLYKTLKGRVPELHIIGDAYAPLRTLQAIRAAYDTAFDL